MTNDKPKPLPVLFAIARTADKESRQAAPLRIHAQFGVGGRIEHVRSDAQMHLYRRHPA